MKKSWNIVYEEEQFDAIDYCSAGLISNGSNFLFFTVGYDEQSGSEMCRVYNSITFAKESLECEYLWTADNDTCLLNCLNNLSDEDKYCGEGSPIRDIDFPDKCN